MNRKGGCAMHAVNNGLSLYNPILYSSSKISKDSNCILLNIFKDISSETDLENIPNYSLNYSKLVEQYKILCALNEYVEQAEKNVENYENLFLSLLNNLIQNKDNEDFWEYLFILEEFLMKLSVVSECRQLIMNNLALILEILKTAVEKEQTIFKSGQITNKSYKCKYSILYFFVANKFKVNSVLDDDVLLQVAVEKCMQEFDPKIFTIIAKYKNCDKFDLAPLDLVEEYRKCQSFKIDYFWIFSQYVLKYKAPLENLLLCILGEDIYAFWLSYIMSNEYKEDTKELSLELIKTNIEQDLRAFNCAGICAYESTNILNKIARERG